MGNCQVNPEVAVDDVAGRPIDEDLRDPADLGEGAAEGRVLLRRVSPPVAWVRDELRGCHLGVADDPASPALVDSPGRSGHAVSSATASRAGVRLMRRKGPGR
jgi:hypothetical protein